LVSFPCYEGDVVEDRTWDWFQYREPGIGKAENGVTDIGVSTRDCKVTAAAYEEGDHATARDLLAETKEIEDWLDNPDPAEAYHKLLDLRRKMITLGLWPINP